VWGKCQQAFCQLNRWGMRAACQNDLLQGMRLTPNGFGNTWFGMAVDIGPPAADGIKDAPTIVPNQPCAFATRHWEQGQGVGVFSHLRAGVPEHGEIARAPSLSGGYHGGIVKSFHPTIIAVMALV